MSGIQAKLADAGNDTASVAGLSLKRNFTWIFGGNVIGILSQFGMLLILARLGTVEMLGQYGLGLAITAPLFLLVGMSLSSVQVTDIHNDYLFSDYAAVRSVSLFIGMTILTLIVVTFGTTERTQE